MMRPDIKRVQDIFLSLSNTAMIKGNTYKNITMDIVFAVAIFATAYGQIGAVGQIPKLTANVAPPRYPVQRTRDIRELLSSERGCQLVLVNFGSRPPPGLNITTSASGKLNLNLKESQIGLIKTSPFKDININLNQLNGNKNIFQLFAKRKLNNANSNFDLNGQLPAVASANIFPSRPQHGQQIPLEMLKSWIRKQNKAGNNR